MRKNPSTYVDLDAWTNPQRMSVQDNLCAYKYVPAGVAGTFRVNWSNYGFNIPADAIISRETIGIRAGKYPSSVNVVTSFYVQHGINTVLVSVAAVQNLCPSSQWSTQDYPPSLWIPVSALNAEDFTSWVQLMTNALSPANDIRVDSIYFEVEYTVPERIGSGFPTVPALLLEIAAVYRLQRARRRRAV